MDSKTKTIVSLLVALVIGAIIGALFYPSRELSHEERIRIEENAQRQVDYYREQVVDLRESHREEVRELRQREEEYRQTIDTQIERIDQLEKRVSTQTYKVIRPDGTIEEQTFTEQEISQESSVVISIREEFDMKIRDIQKRYSEAYTERLVEIREQVEGRLKEKQDRIAELESERRESVNRRSTRIGVGVTSDITYYGLVEKDILGPIFIHGIVETPSDDRSLRGGVGLGISF